jgi:vacuolar-type H+-ATPase subunit H
MTHTADLGNQARGHAADLVGKAKETAHRSVRDATDQARQHVAGEVHGAAEAAQAAANSFDSNGMQAQAAQVIASHLEGAAERVRTLDVEKTVSDVSQFARRNPLLFLSAAALAGFAATRFLKASEPDAAAPDGQPIPTPHIHEGTDHDPA